MELYDEETRRKERNNGSKWNKILILLIVLVIFIIIGLGFAIYYLMDNPSSWTINLNGVENVSLEKMIEITDGLDGNIIISAPIKNFASVVGYRAFNGEYLSSSQDTDKCHCLNNQEVATFYLGSNTISKKDLTDLNSEYEFYGIGEEIYEKNGVLYTSDGGLEKGFNLSMSYNSNRKVLNIYTLDSAVEIAKSRVINSLGYNVSEEMIFANKKAVLDGMIIVTSGSENENPKFGVIDYTMGKPILEMKYDDITYIPSKSEFIIKINNKIGIIDANGQEKISAAYDKLVLIDKDRELYLAQNNGLYGVINAEGKTVIYLEYNQIGIDSSRYEQNGIKSGYIILDKLIPVRQGNKWGFFDVEGKKITELIYDQVGSIKSDNSSTTYNLLAILDSELIVVKKDDKYTAIDVNGKELLVNVFEDAYLRVTYGNIQYFMVWEDKEYNLLDIVNRANS